MSLYRVLFSLLIITSLLAGPVVGFEKPAKKDGEHTEKHDKRKKESSKHDSQNADKKKHHDGKKDDKDRKNGDKNKKKPSKKKEGEKKVAEKKNDKTGDKPKKDAPKNEMKPAPKKDEANAKKAEPKKEPKKEDKPTPAPAKEKPEAKDADKKPAAKQEMKQEPKKPEPKKEEPKKNEPTPAKRPAPKPKMEEGEPKKMESKLEPKAEDKPEQIPPPQDTPKPEPKPEPKPQPKPQPKPDPKKIAFTDLADVDEDFAFQGEYYGKIRLPGGVLESTGIQVIARGDGNFVGRQLRGGLPGNGWRNGHLIDLSGKRDGNQLVLSQGSYQVIVSDDQAVVINSAGDTLGVLAKVHRRSELLGLKPSSAATVLFDGTSADGFVNAKINDQGELQIGTITKDPVQDFRLHLEFRLPYMPYATGQGRSNSGLYIQERYEVQILDSFGLPGEFNECGSLYRTKSPDINMCFPPLTWQTYDVYFRAARFDSEGNKIMPARITVQHNGILVQDNYLLPNKTGAGKPESAEPRPIKLQDHGNPVVFRNVWIEHLGGPVVTSSAETIRTPEKN